MSPKQSFTLYGLELLLALGSAIVSLHPGVQAASTLDEAASVRIARLAGQAEMPGSRSVDPLEGVAERTLRAVAQLERQR